MLFRSVQQILAAIPTLRTRDLDSLLRTVSSLLGTPAAKPVARTAANPAANPAARTAAKPAVNTWAGMFPQQPTPSATGGTTVRTQTGSVHTANPNNPNQKYK